jgi:hypothetical protein
MFQLYRNPKFPHNGRYIGYSSLLFHWLLMGTVVPLCVFLRLQSPSNYFNLLTSSDLASSLLLPLSVYGLL